MLPLAPFAVSAAVGLGKSILGSLAAPGGPNGAEGAKTATEAKTGTEAKARKAATEFEAMFLEQSLDRIAGSEGTEGPLGENGTGGGVYRSWLTKEYAGEVVRSGGVGIADQVYREMMRMQEAGHARS